MYVDAHCHLDFPAFDADRPAVLERARAVGVTQIVLAGVQPATWPGLRALASPDIAWTAGLHPQFVSGHTPQGVLEALERAFANPDPPCGVGEIGLDRRGNEPELQTAIFRAQLAFARERGRPVVLHIVQRDGEGLAIARRDGLPPRTLVHGFTASAEAAQAWIELGAHISLGGGAARPNARRARAAARIIPDERLLLETDAPDQALPDGSSRNEPAALVQIAQAIAALRQQPDEQVLERASANARRLFDLPLA